jgi:hypothetical protein
MKVEWGEIDLLEQKKNNPAFPARLFQSHKFKEIHPLVMAAKSVSFFIGNCLAVLTVIIIVAFANSCIRF